MTNLQIAITLMCTPVLTAIRAGKDSDTVTAILESKIAEHNGVSPIAPTELRMYMLEHIRNILAL